MNPYWIDCPACGHREFLRPNVLLQRMQRLGMLRRLANPDPDLITQLLPAALGKMKCDACSHAGLTAEEAIDDDAEWEQVRNCQKCGEPISAERLEIFPGTERCAPCQQAASQQPEVELEYCSRCGTPMQLKPSTSGGISRYQWKCPGCGLR